MARGDPGIDGTEGGNSVTDSPALAAAISTVKRFLNALESRDLDRAKRLLAPGFIMEFPGGVRFSSLEDLVVWAGSRYRYAHKRYDQFDALIDGDAVVVYCFGMLGGEWLNGDPFADIRFIDRFVLRDGKLVDQRVWNDLAEARP
jgi:hypothetical protein